MPKSPELPPIHTIRRQRVVLDDDLARLYGVTTKVFNQTIQRNAARFPGDFAFQITREEFANLKSQFVTSRSDAADSLRSQIVTLKTKGRGQHRKYPPWAFTEHGAIMAATILRSPRAVAMSVYVVRAFVQMKEALLTNAVILRRLAELYGVSTRRFNEAFKRNATRFPADFVFQLTAKEFAARRSQIVTSYAEDVEKQPSARMWSQIATTSKAQRRRLSNRPWAFTEHGAVMAANVLRSPEAMFTRSLFNAETQRHGG